MTVGYDEFRRWYVGESRSGSGPGSDPSATAEWRPLVESHLRDVSVVIDVGCGDWQHSRLIDWGDARYVGVEVVPELVEELRAGYGGPTREFLLLDPSLGCAGLADLLDRAVPRGAELAICKDVIQHLSDAESALLLAAVLPRTDWLLLVNDTCGEGNVDIEVGGCRHVDPRLPPYSLGAEEVLRMCGGQKLALLIRGSRGQGGR